MARMEAKAEQDNVVYFADVYERLAEPFEHMRSEIEEQRDLAICGICRATGTSNASSRLRAIGDVRPASLSPMNETQAL